MEMLRLFGDHLDDAAALARDAGAVLTELRAVSLLERLDETVPMGPGDTAPATPASEVLA